jgi:hypothetical protein
MYGIRFTNRATGKMVKRSQVGLIDRVKLGIGLIFNR